MCVYVPVCVHWCDGSFTDNLSFPFFCSCSFLSPVSSSSIGFWFYLYVPSQWSLQPPMTHTYMHTSHVKRLHLTGWSAGQSAVLIIGLGEVGGAAAVIRAFWCGLAERKGHTLNISGRATGRDREGWSAGGDCPQMWWLQWLVWGMYVYIQTCIYPNLSTLSLDTSKQQNKPQTLNVWLYLLYCCDKK